MFLHIGESRIVFWDDIVGIFNMGIDDNEDNRQFIDFNVAEDEYKKKDDSDNKSFVVTTGDGIYFSPISSGTLAKREQKKVK